MEAAAGGQQPPPSAKHGAEWVESLQTRVRCSSALFCVRDAVAPCVFRAAHASRLPGSPQVLAVVFAIINIPLSEMKLVTVPAVLVSSCCVLVLPCCTLLASSNRSPSFLKVMVGINMSCALVFLLSIITYWAMVSSAKSLHAVRPPCRVAGFAPRSPRLAADLRLPRLQQLPRRHLLGHVPRVRHRAAAPPRTLRHLRACRRRPAAPRAASPRCPAPQLCNAVWANQLAHHPLLAQRSPRRHHVVHARAPAAASHTAYTVQGSYV